MSRVESAKSSATDIAPIVTVLVISYNTAPMTLDCLRSLADGLGDLPAEIIVVDNASTDDSVAAVRAAFPEVCMIANEWNVGFGAANNQAMLRARGDYFLLLNSDAFPKPGAVIPLVDFLRRHPKVGAIGARLLNRDGSLQASCWRFPSPSRAWLESLGISSLFRGHPLVGDYHAWDHASERRVDFVIGACLLVRKTVYEQVGGFDERFFMYAEESDWQRRMWKAGWEVAFTPDAVATHLGGGSGASEPATINRYFFESLDRYVLKHHGWPGLLSLRAAMAVGAVIRLPLYSFAALLPSRRRLALAKVGLHAWLFVRQLTHWRGLGRTTTQAEGANVPREGDLRFAAPRGDGV